jgi:hypothetical protein
VAQLATTFATVVRASFVLMMTLATAKKQITAMQG